MKKSLKLFLAIFVVMFALTGCGKEDKVESVETEKVDLSKYAGTYIGDYTKLVGSDEKEYDDEFSLVLNEDGTGKHNRNGASYKLTWKLEGEDFYMKETFASLSIEYIGTLKDGNLNIFNGDKEDIWTYEYVYHKEK